MNHNKATNAAFEKTIELFHRFMQQLAMGEEDEAIRELPLAQLRLCGVLSSGPFTMSAISRALGTTLSAVTQLADRLERAGLVQRVLRDDDRRVRCLRLTKRGQRLMQLHADNRRRRMSKVLERLAPSEIRTVNAALQILVRAAAESSLPARTIHRPKLTMTASEVLT